VGGWGGGLGVGGGGGGAGQLQRVEEGLTSSGIDCLPAGANFKLITKETTYKIKREGRT
jgi:hypothetical protein